MPMDDCELSDDGSVNEESGNTTNEWQYVQNGKRRKITKPQPAKSTNFTISQQNRFESLAKADENTKETADVQHSSNPKPPPIFVHGVTDYPKMIQALTAIVEAEQYTTKAMANNVIKINVNTVEMYREVVRFMKDSNIIYHTYQLKEDKPYRVVIRNLHHTIPIEYIKEDLQKAGFKVRNITNITHRVTKLPLPMFYVDLEPAGNNKEIYNLRFLNNLVIKVEPPHKTTNIVQCTRCQQYNHTKAYCNLPYKCVKCGKPHDSKTCVKSKNTPAKCALCGGEHPANYRGCQVHKDLQNKIRQKTPTNRTDINGIQQPPQIHEPQLMSNTAQQRRQQRSYSRVVSDSNSMQQGTDLTLTKFLEEFKTMFTQLVQQNNMILQMLSTVINKLVNNV
jgi:hypothetical protein